MKTNIQQQKSWNNEYKDSQLISQSHKPQKDFLRFIQWLKRNKHLDMYSGIRVLDLGCGIGRNSFYMAENFGAYVSGFDFSEEALLKALKIHRHSNIEFKKLNIGTEPYPVEDKSVDIILDVTSSNALSEQERKHYLAECARVLKKGGYMYVRTLAKEGDKNAQRMVKEFKGGEKDTYIHPQLQIKERIFSGPDFKDIYNQYLAVVRMERKTGYQIFGKQRYKRNYWNIYITTRT